MYQVSLQVSQNVTSAKSHASCLMIQTFNLRKIFNGKRLNKFGGQTAVGVSLISLRKAIRSHDITATDGRPSSSKKTVIYNCNSKHQDRCGTH